MLAEPAHGFEVKTDRNRRQWGDSGTDQVRVDYQLQGVWYMLLTGLPRWDYAVWDTDVWSGTAVESKETVGWNGFGRWLKWRIRHSVVGEQFCFAMGTSWGSPMNMTPAVP